MWFSVASFDYFIKSDLDPLFGDGTQYTCIDCPGNEILNVNLLIRYGRLRNDQLQVYENIVASMHYGMERGEIPLFDSELSYYCA